MLLGYPKLKILFELLSFLLPKINQTQIPKQNPIRGCLKVSLKSPYKVDCCVKDTWPGACHGFGEAQAPSRAESAGAALRESNKTIKKPQCPPPKAAGVPLGCCEHWHLGSGWAGKGERKRCSWAMVGHGEFPRTIRCVHGNSLGWIPSTGSTALKPASSGKRLGYFLFVCLFSEVAARIRADTRRISTESWTKYFISTDADINLVTKTLFCFFVFVLFCAACRL